MHVLSVHQSLRLAHVRTQTALSQKSIRGRRWEWSQWSQLIAKWLPHMTIVVQKQLVSF